MMQGRFKAPLKVACWMIGSAMVIAFLAGAGAGTVFNGIAVHLGALWAGFGWQAVIVGVVLLAWGVFASWRSGEIGGAEE